MKATLVRDFALRTLEDMKGVDPVCLDIKKMTTIADFMVVVTGTSNRHVKAMADELMVRGKQRGITIRGVEGLEQAEWVLVDFGDVLVHLMQGPVRKLYDLESLWQLAPGKKQGAP